MKVVSNQITIKELEEMAKMLFGNFVKAVVDIEKGIMVVDAELHMDLAEKLITEGSKQENLWGINIYPGIEGEDWIEFDSMVNLKPRLNNLTRGVESLEMREKIIKVVNKLVRK